MQLKPISSSFPYAQICNRIHSFRFETTDDDDDSSCRRLSTLLCVRCGVPLHGAQKDQLNRLDPCFYLSRSHPRAFKLLDRLLNRSEYAMLVCIRVYTVATVGDDGSGENCMTSVTKKKNIQT